jgi:MoaA/NifB/PqqE/SkfB family radical SAM enzyme
MPSTHYIIRLIPKILQCKACRIGLVKPGSPITLTYSVTAACQSKCKTCNIGAHYQANPNVTEKDLNLDEIEHIFASVGHVYFFNISGGEPFLRKDLHEIIRIACKHLRPHIIHIPTNAIASQSICDLTIQCLEVIAEYNPKMPLTVKPSIDGVGVLHDEIRGVSGNFRQLEKTIKYLREVANEYPNLQLELGTVVSTFNYKHLPEIEDYVHSLGVQSYRNEIAEQRAEFFNLSDPITPDADTYEKLITEFSAKIRKNLGKKRHLTKIMESLRLVYYDLAVRILREQRQVIPCFAGISNVHINHDGGVWPCCVLGYSKPMGFLRDYHCDFQKVWHSDRAKEVRRYIRDGNCSCPLANQAYSNILCSPNYLLRALRNLSSFS